MKTVLRLTGRALSLLIKLTLVTLIAWYGYCTYFAAYHLFFYDDANGERLNRLMKMGFSIRLIDKCYPPGKSLWEIPPMPLKYIYGWEPHHLTQFASLAFMDSLNVLASLTPGGAFMVWQGHVGPNKTRLTWEDRPWEYWYERHTSEMHAQSMSMDYMFWTNWRCRMREPNEIKYVPYVEISIKWVHPDTERKLTLGVAAVVGAVVLWGSKVFDRRKPLTKS